MKRTLSIHFCCTLEAVKGHISQTQHGWNDDLHDLWWLQITKQSLSMHLAGGSWGAFDLRIKLWLERDYSPYFSFIGRQRTQPFSFLTETAFPSVDGEIRAGPFIGWIPSVLGLGTHSSRQYFLADSQGILNYSSLCINFVYKTLWWSGTSELLQRGDGTGAHGQ